MLVKCRVGVFCMLKHIPRMFSYCRNAGKAKQRGLVWVLVSLNWIRFYQPMITLHQITRRIGPSSRSLKLKEVTLFDSLCTGEGALRMLPAVML